MTDITKRLRYKAGMSYRRRDAGLYEDAADEIERLRALLKEHDDLAKIDEDLLQDSNWSPRLRMLIGKCREVLNGPTGSD